MNWGSIDTIITRRDAIARGYTDAELYRAKRQGELVSVGQGAYAHAERYRHLDGAGRHRLAIHASVARMMNRAVISHVSAAVLHGLDVWGLDLSKVHVTLRQGSGGTTLSRRVLHAGPVEADDVTVVDGMEVTTPARTVVDIACTAGFEEAVVVGDHALRAGTTTLAKLHIAIDRARYRMGVVQARRVVEFLDVLAESVGESRSRAKIVEAGFPKPELQQPIYDNLGNLVARVAFLWREFGIIGEFDSAARCSMIAGGVECEVFSAGRRREERLRALGYVVVRWTWEDLECPQQLRALLAQAFSAIPNRGRRR